MKGKILIADDEVRIRKMIALLLKEEGYEVKAVKNGREALDAIPSFNPDVVLLDQQMPVMTGLEALEEIKKNRPNQAVIFITAFGTVALAVDAVKKGAYDFIEKPFDNDELVLKVNRAVEHCRLKGEIQTLKKRLDKNNFSIIGDNAGLKQVVSQVKRVAATNATVLIHGESGTGKNPAEKEGESIKEINAQVEKEIILEALKKHNYNRTLTAEALQISRKTLFNKMKRYGLG